MAQKPFMDSVALITGATSGIGLATAEAFAKVGCKAVLWLASPENSFTTGITLPLDGGFTAQ